MKFKNHKKKLLFKKVTIARLDNRQMGSFFGGKETIPSQVECESDDCGTVVCFTLIFPCSAYGEICPQTQSCQLWP